MKLCEKFKPFFELLDDDKSNGEYDNIRYVILIGGRGGAKSHALSTWINQASYKQGWGILFTRYTMTSAETSIIPEFRAVCESLNNDNDFAFKRTQVINQYANCVIDYKGLKPTSNNSTGALKSVSGKNIFVLEEAEDCPDFELFDKVDNSIRTIKQKNLIILCLNQGHIHHWIYKEFIEQKRNDVMVIETSYLDNLEFLDDSFIKKAERCRERDLKRYRHIYLNDWKTDVDGALWVDSDISPYRITTADFEELKTSGKIARIAIAYDPAVTDSEKPKAERIANTGNEPDEDGIIIGAKSIDNHYYIIADKSCRGKRSEVTQKLVDLYHDYDCEAIIIEKNNGGDFIPALIKTAQNGKYVKCRTVTATKGKFKRAQPVQSVYENGEVHHVGHFSELEYEMTTWVPDIGLPSPNHLDAMVWLIFYLSGKGKFQIGATVA
jgi:PBSX family phage terminase large subunit